MNLGRLWGNEMVMVIRYTRVGSVDQVSPQRAEHGFFVRVDPFQETLLKVVWWRVVPHCGR